MRGGEEEQRQLHANRVLIMTVLVDLFYIDRL